MGTLLMAKNIAYEKDGKVIFASYADDNAEISFDHIVLVDLPNEPNEVFYIEDGELKINQDKLAEYKRTAMQPLSKRQFALHLHSIKNEDDTTMYDTVINLINSDPIAKIEYDTVTTIERLSPTVLAMINVLGWTDEFVDEQWELALQI